MAANMDKLKDKLPPPALNRPVTQQRVPDPGRFRSIDMQPENAQQDPSYQRMVQDIEALQHRGGWLAGRGAFDKEDLLYLRDREEQQRTTEQQQRDMEAAAYAAARARVEHEQEAAARATLRQQQPAKQQHNKSTHSRGAVPVLKVKAHHGREQHQHQSAGQPEHHQQQQQQQQQQQEQPQRDRKRQRLDSTGEAAASVPAAATATVKDFTAAAAASCSVPVQQGSNHAAAPSNTATCSRANVSAQGSAQLQQQGKPQGKQEDRGGLEGLLSYSSESDAEEDANPGKACLVADIPQQGLKLPSAAELLEQDMPSSFARAASSKKVEEDTPVPVVGSAATYQHHSGWI